MQGKSNAEEKELTTLATFRVEVETEGGVATNEGDDEVGTRLGFEVAFGTIFAFTFGATTGRVCTGTGGTRMLGLCKDMF